MNNLSKEITLLAIIIGIFLFINSGLAATTCAQKYQGYGQCATDCDALGADYQKDPADAVTTGLCSTGSCCYKTGGSATGNSALQNLDLQVPIFDQASVNNLPQYIATLYRYILIILVPLAIVMIIVGGVSWIAAAGNQSKITNAKKYITSAFAGLVIGLFSYLLLSLVGIDTLRMPGIENIPAHPNADALQYELSYGPPVPGGNPGKTTKDVCNNIISKPDLVNAYKSASAQTGVPWQILAAIHFREHSNSTSSPSGGGGPMQILNSYGKKPGCQSWPVCLVCAANFINSMPSKDPQLVFCYYNAGPAKSTSYCQNKSSYTNNDPDNGVIMNLGQTTTNAPDKRPGALILYKALLNNCQ